MNRSKNYEVQVKNGRYVLINVVTKNEEDVSVRPSIIKKAYTNGEIIQISDTGRTTRLSGSQKDKIVKLAEDADKVNYKSQAGIRDEEVIFATLSNLTRMVARGVQPSFLVTGLPGMGKTYGVKETLTKCLSGRGANVYMKESVDFVVVKGKATEAGLFMALSEYRDKLIIFDDCDSVLKDPNAMELLKGALDSYDSRTISYLGQKPLRGIDGKPIEPSFEFTGKIIFITNLPQAKVDAALKSRSFVWDVSLTTSQMIERIQRKMESIERKIPIQTKQKALEVLVAVEKKYQGVTVDMRSFIKVARIISMGWPEKETKEMILGQLCLEEK